MAKTAKTPTGHVRQAVGSFEAAALMGVHFSIPQKLAARGKLSAHAPAISAWSAAPSRSYAIYDGAECDRDFRQYEALVASRGGKSERRPRGWLHLRPDVLRHLKAVKTPIAFEDAISTAEAAKILGVHVTFVPRMVEAGKIVGRRPWNPRSSAAKVWLISRRSCLANVRQKKALVAAGGVTGRPRKNLS